jgi:rfaE bifunctional protein kinase chain/domain
MQILDKFPNTKVLIVGDVMLDRYWWGGVGRISPEAPVPVVRLNKTTLAAGGAANVAANVAGLGAVPILVGVVGIDAEAESIRRILEESNVISKHLIGLADRHTTVKTRVIAHSQQVARVDLESDTEIGSDVEDRLVKLLEVLIADSDAVVISDYAKGLLTDRLLSIVMNMARAAGRAVLVDPKGKNYKKYAGATLITPNRREAAEACNLSENSASMVETAGERLIGELDIDSLLITQGEEGMTLFRRDREPEHFPAAAREVYDVTGAGDTVIATLATAIGAGSDLQTATLIANAAAGVVVEQIGTTAITLSGVRDALNGWHRPK